LAIQKVVRQLLPMSIRPAEREQSKTGNSSHPGPSDDRGKPSPHEKKMKTSATVKAVPESPLHSTAEFC
jgi:hypothetical protein